MDTLFSVISSPLLRRLMIVPIFIIIVQFILFFVNVLKININMGYIIIAMISVPAFSYMVIGGN